MANVWFVGQDSTRPVWELPFGVAVGVLDLTEECYAATSENPPAVPAGTDFGRNQQVYLEVREDEIKAMPGRKAGFYLSPLSSKESLGPLSERGIGAELDVGDPRIY